ncbi:MarR family transcriptional regulator [Sphingomonas sp. LHG3406-1]|uniref:MarR family transcriptional regulator n=1 Tax=Sphingomonas sp. LHG3406-1 TaxID=2804617 RepID=UPI002627054F|nr:MarR family transcriptional regulator [Sphingomonas sp. LHG3406-1]
MSFFDQRSGEGFGPKAEEGQTMALSADEVAAARSLLSKLVQAAPEQDDAGVRRGLSAIEIAKSVYQSRKRRLDYFGPVLFSEPAWDMLLVLFIYGDGGDQLSVTKLAEFSQSPLTTAIRWLDYLESQRLIVRQQCQSDRRKFFVELSAKGRKLLEEYFTSLPSINPPS